MLRIIIWLVVFLIDMWLAVKSMQDRDWAWMFLYATSAIVAGMLVSLYSLLLKIRK